MEKTVEKLNSYLDYLENKDSPKNKYNSKNIETGVLKVVYALKNDMPVVVYGDYDTDGVLSSLMVYIYIKKIKEKLGLKSKTDIVFSDRKDFFGMGKDLYKEFSEKYGLIIMTDNGSTESFLTKDINNLLILDHHPTDYTFNYIINPNINTNIYSTSGGKVVFDFLRILDKNIDRIFNVSMLNKDDVFLGLFKQLTTITLISDMANLSKTNRNFIKNGLELMKKKELPVFHLLRDINSIDISYNIVSKINAVSRMEDDLGLIVKWLFPKNKEEFEFANKKINQINNKKKKYVLDIYSEIPIEKFRRNIVTIYNPEMPIGLTGLLANKILSEYNKPAIIVSKEKDYFVGSARGKNIKDFFDKIKTEEEDFFIEGEYGGHLDAMGFRTQSLNDLKKIEKYIDTFEYKEKFKVLTDKVLTFDEYIMLDKIYKERAKGVDYSEPVNVFVKLELEKLNKKEFKKYIHLSYNDFEMLLDKKTYDNITEKPLMLVNLSVSKLANVKSFINNKYDIIFSPVLENNQKNEQAVKVKRNALGKDRRY
jgi:single-stranded-DNA-specific exonuclease